MAFSLAKAKMFFHHTNRIHAAAGVFLAGLTLCNSSALASGPAKVQPIDGRGATKQVVSSAAPAVAADMRAKLQSMYPQRVIGPVATTQIPGIFEVLTDDKISYVDASGKYWLFNGQLVDLPAQVNITEVRLGEVNRIDPRTLPLGDAIKMVKGKGERTLFVFADPNCGFCKKLEADLKDMDNVTVYTFLYPILRNSREPAAHVWCSSDRAKTWDDLMVRGVQPLPGACDTPLERNLALGQRLNVTGTPTMFSADGRRLAGAVGAAGVNAFLN